MSTEKKYLTDLQKRQLVETAHQYARAITRLVVKPDKTTSTRIYELTRQSLLSAISASLLPGNTIDALDGSKIKKIVNQVILDSALTEVKKQQEIASKAKAKAANIRDSKWQVTKTVSDYISTVISDIKSARDEVVQADALSIAPALYIYSVAHTFPGSAAAPLAHALVNGKEISSLITDADSVLTNVNTTNANAITNRRVITIIPDVTGVLTPANPQRYIAQINTNPERIAEITKLRNQLVSYTINACDEVFREVIYSKVIDMVKSRFPFDYINRAGQAKIRVINDVMNKAKEQFIITFKDVDIADPLNDLDLERDAESAANAAESYAIKHMPALAGGATIQTVIAAARDTAREAVKAGYPRKTPPAGGNSIEAAVNIAITTASTAVARVPIPAVANTIPEAIRNIRAVANITGPRPRAGAVVILDADAEKIADFVAQTVYHELAKVTQEVQDVIKNTFKGHIAKATDRMIKARNTEALIIKDSDGNIILDDDNKKTAFKELAKKLTSVTQPKSGLIATPTTPVAGHFAVDYTETVKSLQELSDLLLNNYGNDAFSDKQISLLQTNISSIIKSIGTIAPQNRKVGAAAVVLGAGAGAVSTVLAVEKEFTYKTGILIGATFISSVLSAYVTSLRDSGENEKQSRAIEAAAVANGLVNTEIVSKQRLSKKEGVASVPVEYRTSATKYDSYAEYNPLFTARLLANKTVTPGSRGSFVERLASAGATEISSMIPEL